jgi:DNA-binding transcriptional LysR family regulator
MSVPWKDFFHTVEQPMDRLRLMEVFIAVNEAGSLAAAASRLNMSPPAVTRAISALEDRLGARLLNRTTRRLSLTDAGARYLESGRHLLAAFEAAERAAVGETATPSGHLTVAASVTFGRMHVAPVLAAFLRAEPRVSASLLMADRVVNLVEEGVDLAVRIGSLPDSSLVARRIGETRQILVASPGYLASRGEPARPEELRLHDIIAFTGLMAGREWRHRRDDGRTETVALSPRLTVNDAAAALAAAERGEGITVALSYMAAPLLQAGRLATLLERFTPPAVPIQLVYPQARLLAPKIRAFIDFAAPRLKESLGARGV